MDNGLADSSTHAVVASHIGDDTEDFLGLAMEGDNVVEVGRRKSVNVNLQRQKARENNVPPGGGARVTLQHNINTFVRATTVHVPKTFSRTASSPTQSPALRVETSC